MKKIWVCILTSFLITNFMVARVFATSDDTFTDFIDVDPDTLVSIKDDYLISDIKYNVSKNVIVDSAVSYAFQQNFELSGTNNVLHFTGSYYDNTITGLNACNSSQYEFTSEHIDAVENVTIHPWIYGSIDAFGLQLNYGIEVNDQNLGEQTIQSNTVRNSTEACRIIGFEDGDGAVDGAVLLGMGYEKKTYTYNDGSPNGHTATVFVPGDESISFSTSDLDDLIDHIFVQVLNGLVVDYHYEYILSFHTTNKIMPQFGRIQTDSWLPFIIDPAIISYTSTNMDSYGISVKEENNAYVHYNKSFTNTTDQNGRYKDNYSIFVWQDTSSPEWVFRSRRFRSDYTINSGSGVNSNMWVQNEYLSGWFTSVNGSWSDTVMNRTVQDYMAANNPNYLTTGNLVPYGFYNVTSYDFYKIVDSGRLSLFNQLGAFLQRQFNRIVDGINEITGGDNITEVVENDYNVDIDVTIPDLIDNFNTTNNAIDLTGSDFVLDNDDSLNTLSDIPLETIKIFTDNKLGIFVILPIVICILGLIL